jgi:hypothetical protein
MGQIKDLIDTAYVIMEEANFKTRPQQWLDRKAFKAKCGLIKYLTNHRAYMVNISLVLPSGEFIVTGITMIGDPPKGHFIIAGTDRTEYGLWGL